MVIFDRETAAAFGINVTAVYTATFVLGAVLGALGGAVMAPKISVTLGIGVEVIVLAFAVVAIGGMGSIEGALVGALIVGLCRAAAVHLVPQVELFVIYASWRWCWCFVPTACSPGRSRGRFDMTGRANLVGALAFLLAAAVAPGLPPWLVSLATIAFANALVVLGLMVMWRAGLVSFGQALYYAIGAYAVALLSALPRRHRRAAHGAAGGAAAAVAAFLVGFLLARYREIFFAMLSLAVSMILYGVLVKTEALGSTDGFNVAPATFFGQAPDGHARNLWLFWLVLAISAVAALVVGSYFRSIAGALAVPVRDNEIRVEFLGVSVNRLIHSKLMLAGALGRRRRRARGARGRPCRSQHGLLDDVRRLRLRHHPGGGVLGRRRLRRLAAVRAGALRSRSTSCPAPGR